MKLRQFVFLLFAFAIVCGGSAHAQVKKIYWSDPNLGTISRSNLDGSQVQTIINTGEDIAYITSSSTKLFYTIGSPTPQIWSADFDGTNRTLLATLDNANFPRGLAYNSVSQKLFWTSFHGSDDSNGTIRTMNTNGTGLVNILSLSTAMPYGMAVDGSLGKMFWANTGTDELRIANVNGTGATTINTTNVGDTAQVAVDPVTQKLYWTDVSSSSVLKSNYNGTSMTVVGSITPGALDSGITVDNASGYLFWGDTFLDRIYRSDLNGGGATAIISSGLSYPMSLTVVSVPEPATYLFVGCLVLGAGWIRHRRKQIVATR
jgi:hypothetical protein